MNPYQSDVLARGRVDRLLREAALYRLAVSATGRRPGTARIRFSGGQRGRGAVARPSVRVWSAEERCGAGR